MRVIVGICPPVVLGAVVAALLSAGPACSEGEERDGFEAARSRMVRDDIAGRGITDRMVLRAMGAVPRHLFVHPTLQGQAYADHPLPIGEGQTISQPYVVALMTEALRLTPGDRVLEVGTGSGYQAAVLGEIVERVFSVEIRPGLAERARENLRAAGYGNVSVKTGDGYFGWEDSGPYDAVIVTAAANHVAPPLISQLKVGGRLIIPLGRTTFYQYLTLIEKTADGLKTIQMGGVAFVPMIGEVENPKERSQAPP